LPPWRQTGDSEQKVRISSGDEAQYPAPLAALDAPPPMLYVA